MPAEVGLELLAISNSNNKRTQDKAKCDCLKMVTAENQILTLKKKKKIIQELLQCREHVYLFRYVCALQVCVHAVPLCPFKSFVQLTGTLESKLVNKLTLPYVPTSQNWLDRCNPDDINLPKIQKLFKKNLEPIKNGFGFH